MASNTDLTASQNPPNSVDDGTGGQKPKAGASVDPSNPMATINDDDERLLARIGYKQVRAFSVNRKTGAQIPKGNSRHRSNPSSLSRK